MIKTKTLRASIFICAFALITSSLVARTFANYSTKASGENLASVAYWGFTAKDSSINLKDLFKNSYTNIDGNEVVRSTSNVIAPGTKGSATFSFPYGGSKEAPEVDYEFTVSVEGSSIDDSLNLNPNIQWSLNSQEDEDFGTWNQLMNKIIRLSGDSESIYTKNQPFSMKHYKAGEIPPAFTKGSQHTIYWRWKSSNSGEDNSLGNAPTMAKVNLKITITANQVE